MLRFAIIVLCVACKKDAAETKPVIAATQEAPVTAKTVQNGVRRVDIEANKDGYTPGRITGKPGEKLTLVFKRTIDAECLSQVRMPDGKVVDLPLNKQVEIEVTVPQQGELAFACGMDMFKGTIVATPQG